MKLLLLFLCLALVACTAGEVPVNDTEPYYGEVLNFTFEKTKLSLDEDVIVLGVNTTKEVYLFEYCGIPVAMVRHDEDGAWRYKYPHIDECTIPQNTTLQPNHSISLSDIPTRHGPLEPGEYRLKMFYSVVAPGVHMRENNQVIWITE